MNRRPYKKFGNGDYEASPNGDVFSVKFGKEVKLRSAINSKGYLQVCLCEDGKQKTVVVHRIIAETLIPNPFNLSEVHHKNGIKTDNHKKNLEWISGEDHRILEHAKVYNFTDPEGNKIEVYNLKSFCKENGLDDSNMLKLHSGKSKSCKGYTKT